MSATEVNSLPSPSMDLADEYTTSYVTPDAPTQRRTRPMNVKAIPFELKEEDKFEDLFTGEVEPSNDWKDPDDLLEAVFFNRHKNMIYKLFIDGTWEALRVTPDLLM